MLRHVFALAVACVASCSSASSPTPNPCDTAKCDANATCSDVNGAAVCSCNLGFVGSGTQCAQCAPCGPGKFQSAACTNTKDTQCTACSTCGNGTFQTGACSALADTQCTSCSTCPQGKFTSTACTSTTDTQCSACSGACGMGQFESAPCTPNADRACSMCSTTCPQGQYLKTPCTPNADRVCVPPPNVPTNGLLVRWTLDDAKGTVAADSSGNKRNGALKNSTWVANNCKLGACAQFKGTSGGNGSYLTYANTVPIGGSGASFAAWVQLDKPSTGTYQTLFNGPYDNCCTMRFLIDGQLHPFWDPGTYADQSLGNYTFPVSQWIHVVWTVAAGGNAILYVNGANVAQSGAGVPNVLVDLPNVDVAAADTFQWPLKGLMNDVLIYSRVLSPAEITALVQSY